MLQNKHTTFKFNLSLVHDSIPWCLPSCKFFSLKFAEKCWNLSETALKNCFSYCIFFSWNTSEHISATLLNISEIIWTISETVIFLKDLWTNPYFTSWSKICSEKILNIFQHHCWTNLKHLNTFEISET